MQLPKSPGLQEPLAAPPLATPALPVPSSYAEIRAERRSALGIRAWLLLAFLFAVPLTAYWPATFHDYGLRDDYSNLREAHEEPGKIEMFCASHARPIYGWLLQSTYGQTTSVQNLQWMRLCGSLILGAIALFLFRGLRSLGWSLCSSLCVALLTSLLPAAQVMAGWAVGWPYAVTALLSLGPFFIVESALDARRNERAGRAFGQWFVALGLMVVCALIYQSSAMFYVVPLAAALIVQRQRNFKRTVRWLAFHLGLVAAALAIAYATMTLLYSAGVYVKSGRVAFEHHWLDKAAWFFGEALPNALSFLVLNDNNHHNHALYLICAGVVGAILLAGGYLEWQRFGRSRGMVWLAGLLGLPVAAFAISLVASEKYATYRTIFAMTAVLICFLVASVRALNERWKFFDRRVIAVLTLVTAYFTAQHHVYALMAVPQGNEWQLIVAGAKQVRLDPNKRPSIFAIASSPADLSTTSIYHDEFGSLSSNSEWVPKEMFKRAMHDLHPDIANLESRYDFAEGYKLPAGQHYDVIINMHDLRRFHTDN
jgi:hypothetical protein